MKQPLIKVSDSARGTFLALTIILGFIFIVLFSTLYVSDAIKNNNACGCIIPIPYMIILLSSLGLFIGSLSYYILISKHVKEKKKIGENIEFTLQFLDNDERTVFKTLIKNKEGLKQSMIEKNTGINKVKVHRIINKMAEKGIIIKDSQGKSNKISLPDELKDIF